MPVGAGTATKGSFKNDGLTSAMRSGVTPSMCGWIDRSAAVAASSDCSGFNRMSTANVKLRRSSISLRLPGMSDSVPSGMATSNAWPTSIPRNSGGVTPTIVKGAPSSVRVLPIASAEPSKRSRQSRSLITATGPLAPPPLTSSSAVRRRPTRAWTPSVLKKLPLTSSARAGSFSPLRARLNVGCDHRSVPSKSGGACCRRVHIS